MAFLLKQPKNRELVGGDLLAQSLAKLGATTAFGIHAVEADIKLIDVRHETVAVQAAEGWAKVKGNSVPGVCFITANSGFCNGLPGLSTAFADRSPVFCITSSAPLRDAETNTLQGFHDQVVLAKPVTKFVHRVTTVSEIPRVVSLAWRATTAGAPGPVLVDFPIDILFTPVRQESVSWGSVIAPPVSSPAPDPKAIDEAIVLWREAKRPAIIVSTGAASATAEITKLAELSNTPIFHSPKFSTTIHRVHPLFGGPATQLPILRIRGGQAPDFVVLVGTRTGFLMGGRSGSIIPNEDEAKVVQVDLDGSEIGRSRKIDVKPPVSSLLVSGLTQGDLQVGIVADAGLAAKAFISAVSQSPLKASEEWTSTAMSLKKQNLASAGNATEPVILKDNNRLHPYHGVRTIFQSLPESSIVCIDGGEASGWASQCLNEARAELSIMTTGYLGFLGNGFGYSLGAAVAAPDKLVVNIHGDGSAGFHIGELDTYAKFGLNILTVVVNNAVWGMSQAGQDMLYGEKTPQRPCVAMNPNVKYELVAQGFGCQGAVVDVQEDDGHTGEKTLESLKAAVGRLATFRGPGLLNLKVSDVPYHGTTKAMVGKTDDPNIIVVPYYDNLPRPHYH